MMELSYSYMARNVVVKRLLPLTISEGPTQLRATSFQMLWQ